MASVKDIPKTLIYEEVNGVPIFYKGYKDYLSGQVELEEIMGSSKIQSFLVVELIFFLKMHFAEMYYVLANALGLQFGKNSFLFLVCVLTKT